MRPKKNTVLTCINKGKKDNKTITFTHFHPTFMASFGFPHRRLLGALTSERHLL
jgi:hypothetical protein